MSDLNYTANHITLVSDPAWKRLRARLFVCARATDADDAALLLDALDLLGDEPSPLRSSFDSERERERDRLRKRRRRLRDAS